MNIVVYGDATIENSGGWCYAETLVEMGHQVTRVSASAALELYEATLPGRAVRRLLGRPPELHRRVHGEHLVLAAKSARADIVIIIKGINVAAQDVLAMKAFGAWVVLINHDDFFSANPNNYSVTQRAALPHYDLVLATRTVNVDELRPINANVEFFPFAYYPRIHRPVPLSEAERGAWATDAVFVGTWEAERASLMEQLVQAVPMQLAIWGDQWERVGRRSALRPYLRQRPLFGDDMARALGGAKIALAFLRKKNRDDYTQRTFEIPACQGVLLGERTNQHLAYLREGVDAEFFDPSNPAELIAKTRLLLANEAHRESVRRAGYAAVTSGHHTYRDRLLRLLELHAQRAA